MRGIVEYTLTEEDGEFWINVSFDRQSHDRIGPFDSLGSAERAYDDLIEMMRATGAIDAPNRLH